MLLRILATRPLLGALLSRPAAQSVAHRPLLRRPLHLSASRRHDDSLKDVPETITVHFIKPDDTRVTVKAKEGERALFLAHRYDIPMEGACEASLACTTCHCYVEGRDKQGADFLDLLPEATEDEDDLLDSAPFLAENSRLGCQVFITPELEGVELRLPKATRNFYVDGHTPTPH